MKNKFIIITLLLMSAISLSSQQLRADNPAPATTTSTTTIVAADQKNQAIILLNRLDEIQKMDKSDLTNSDKRKLRKEVRGINMKLSHVSGGIYLSVGTVILIVVLLIIFL